ncbi:ferrous iron transport protein B [Methanobrevibacter olleyae]|uniref:Ferrous iron transport protein B n=1 Tax=Methanobrevibacter olleyae TaxID=294671 RepID=A0A1I4I452_METOL|nr:ferrous iron transport protein B [Methanobrevibacter olleyae]SFL49135.1 ferrous iron transport protein B [Methanobrevibacter olleyae]
MTKINSKINSETKNLNKKDKSYYKNILLIGSPNVGKSLTFNKLTGMTAMVSNYPGTTVDIDEGNFTYNNKTVHITDPPGLYDLNTITEEERVAKLLVLDEEFDLMVHIVDAKNIEKSIDLTLQLIDAGKEVILVLNMMDELEKMGASIDAEALSHELGIPIVLTSAAENNGLDNLKHTIVNYDSIEDDILKNSDTLLDVDYGSSIERSISEIKNNIKGKYPVSKRYLAVSLLEGDADSENLVKETEDYTQLSQIINDERAKFDKPLKYLTKLRLADYAKYIKSNYTTIDSVNTHDSDSFAEKLSRIMIHPVYGLIILACVLYFGLYLIVGVLGAGILVDFLENTIFGEYINPALTDIILQYIPWVPIQNLFVGEYGIVTLGLTYGFGIILPIVSLFFIVFSILEDSGYLPRLALLVDNGFKKIGLSGRSVIPFVLAVGCGSMATMVTRTLETKRERNIATMLMALTIPCSAQLGVIMALLSARPKSIWIWLAVIIFDFVLIGYLAKRFVPGSQPSFFMELPPLRLPKLSNIAKKTWTRLVMYIKELIPIFVLISVIIWALDLCGIFQWIIYCISPFVNAIGLPSSTSSSFVLGFFRRDFGAAGLMTIQSQLTGVQLLVASITLTLFLPCVAQLMIMIKERGLKLATFIAILSIVLAFTMGFIVNLLLHAFNVVL